MEQYSFVVAILALLVSIFTFYWTSLRKSRALTLVYINRFASVSPEFVIANGCNFDLLIVHVTCILRGGKADASLYPSQNCELTSKGGSLVPAGRAVHFRIDITEPLRKEDLEDGMVDPRFVLPPLRQFDVFAQVHWIEPSGREYQSECKFSTYGFKEDGHIMATQELERKFSLYEIKKELLPGSRPIVP